MVEVPLVNILQNRHTLGSLLARPKNHKEKTSVRGTDFGMVIFDSIALQASVTDECSDTAYSGEPSSVSKMDTRREERECSGVASKTEVAAGARGRGVVMVTS